MLKFWIVAIAALATVGCDEKSARDNAMVAACENHIKDKLRSPATYDRIEATVGWPDEKARTQDVFVKYDAANAYGTPIRELEVCRFPYSKEDERIRPVTDDERRISAEVAAEHGVSNLSTPPECCMSFEYRPR